MPQKKIGSYKSKTGRTMPNIDARREIALNVYTFCKEEAARQCYKFPVSQPRARASAMTRIPAVTLSKMMRTKNEPSSVETGRKTRSTKIEIDAFDEDVIRRTIHDMILRKVALPTLKNLLETLSEKIGFTGKRETLRVILKNLGYTWKKCVDNRKILMERSDIIQNRIHYLKQIKKFREEGRTIVYTNETYVHAAHTIKKCLQIDNTGVMVPFSKGERMIVLHAGSSKGFIPNAKLVFKAHSSTGDYHQEMNFNNFFKWLPEKLIPNLEPNSVLILDNAAYQNVQYDKCPTSASRKAEMQEWLRKQQIAFPDKMSRPELLVLCRKHKHKPRYMVDEILEQHGHKALRLPQYHAELNAIELIWAQLKGYVASKNLSFKLNNVVTLIDEGFDRTGPTLWKACCDHVQKVETRFRQTDIAIDDEIERVVINLADDESDNDDD